MTTVKKIVADFLTVQEQVHKRAYDLVIVRHPSSKSYVYLDSAITSDIDNVDGFMVEFKEVRSGGWNCLTFSINITFEHLEKTDSEWEYFLEQERIQLLVKKKESDELLEQLRIKNELDTYNRLKAIYG
jgi:hypothetical protein